MSDLAKAMRYCGRAFAETGSAVRALETELLIVLPDLEMEAARDRRAARRRTWWGQLAWRLFRWQV